MSGLHVEELVVRVPDWLADMEFCHVGDEGEPALCGHDDGIGNSNTCGDEYEGEAICPTCGRPTCPRCAQLSDLEGRLDG